ncbi:hypothetical protein H6P81_017762 [Aristolochia fimbriata]|uniref:Uncharacterized protein n=1 Tax=Aristolochia fimbriata TaxID=158543 RepID=A0AAV7DZI8_ARIFI|nr:hypothetical protein H6P81_017762 [Aristolochia fimbriata]
MKTSSTAVVALIFLIACAFTAAATRVFEDPRIVQVTDKKNNNLNRLLGTEKQFQIFVQKYGKEYKSRGEYLHRLSIFAKNMARAAEHQALDPSAVHGVTPFSDLSESEFEVQFTGLKTGKKYSAFRLASRQAAPSSSFPENFDWREKGAVTGVKFQGTCGSCWAFSTTGVIEGAHFISTGKLLNLSEQQLVDCDNTCDEEEKDACNKGCDGGLMTNAYKYVMEAGGLEEESSYPYTASRGACKFNPERAVVKVVNFTKIPLEEGQIKANLLEHGPLAVGLNAAFMQTYIGGVSCPLICPKKYINHGVLLVGYGAKGFSLLRLGKKPYWVIKNSWGAQWGENGFYRLCRGYNMCGVDNMVSLALTATI